MQTQAIQLHPMLYCAQTRHEPKLDLETQQISVELPVNEPPLASESENHVNDLRAIASAWNDYSAHRLQGDSDECAISTDDESDDASSSIFIRGSHKHSPVTITKPARGSDCKTQKRRSAMSEGEKDKEKPVVKQVAPVPHITGPQMSVWPLSLDY
jgi:hypothetical protein